MTPTFSTLPTYYTPRADTLADRVILVTGAGQGLGRAAAIVFAQHGASVILHGRNVAKLEATYDAIEALGAPQPAIMPLDFSQTTQAELDGFAQSIHVTFKRLDGIFHAATHFTPLMPLALQDLDVWRKHTDVNLAVPAALTKACLPMLKRAPQASVVWLTETHAEAPKPYWGGFAASKSALLTLAEIWQHEMVENESARFSTHFSLRFRVCLPGPVASPSRPKSHPGELTSSLPSPESLGLHFVYLMSGDSAANTAILHQCQPT
jgi:NAD(P)-dependent dehydrogenase (short-subunit alcohol dehydrogenase family)